MKKNLSGAGRHAFLGLALAGWLSALTGDGWKLLLPQEPAPPPVSGELSVDGVSLGDEESTVRSLWGQPLQVVSDMTAEVSDGTQQGYRYLRYPGARMVVLHDNRVVVVDGGVVGADSRELPRVGDSRAELLQTLGRTRGEKTPNSRLLTYELEGGAKLQYALQEGRVALVSLSRFGG